MSKRAIVGHHFIYGGEEYKCIEIMRELDIVVGLSIKNNKRCRVPILHTNFLSNPTKEIMMSEQFFDHSVTDMLIMQETANREMQGANWLTLSNEDRPDYRAAWIEAAEGVMHYGFKWWKSETPDIDQIKLEIVDILHFLLSDVMRSAYRSFADSQRTPTTGQVIDRATNMLLAVRSETPEQHTDLISVFEFFVARTILAREVHLHSFGKMCVHPEINLTGSDLFLLYVGKNCLNLFRTANGQKSGTYQKIWAGKEDNVYLFDIVSHIEDGSWTTLPELQGMITAELQQLYSTIVTDQNS